MKQILAVATLTLSTLMLAPSAWGFDCSNVTLPSSAVICSDPELMRIADERQQAMNEARARLSPEQYRALIADQNAWIRSYSAGCGVPADGGFPEPPIAPSVRACFKRAGEARTAYIRAYGGQPSMAPAPAPQPAPASDRIGPGFDCEKVTTPLPLMICADPDLSRVDLAFNQAYWALHQDLEGAERKQLAHEDNQFLETVQNRCGVPRTGGLTAEVWRSRDCVRQAYEEKRRQWMGDLSGPAHEEATRPLPLHIALESKLRQLGYLSGPVVPEGVYGRNTRQAIAAWQEARGRETTGLLGNADALALQREGEQPPRVQQAAIPPEPRVTPSPSPAPEAQKNISLGTAFAINNTGDFLTNYHVVKGCNVVHSRINAGRELDGRIVASDERNDLAVVHIPGAEISPVHFREGKGIRPADSVVALGFPYAGLLASTPQVTVGAVSALAGLEDDSRYLQLTAPVQPGNSGGPLFDTSGNVVGVVSGRINDLAVAKATGSLPQNINFAIKSGIVREFLDANRIAYLTAPSSAKLDPADVGEVATKSTVLIGCSN
jgi:S1-C subfamily serine protease/uncharacterized protein